MAPTAGRKLSLAACAELIEAVFRWRERPDAGDGSWQPPTLGDGRGRRHACGSRQVIKLPRWARTRIIVLHECAHGMSDDGHGPNFVRAYVTLLAAFTPCERSTLEASLRAHKVKIAPASVNPDQCGARLAFSIAPCQRHGQMRVEPQPGE